jgi:hypothetical protein
MKLVKTLSAVLATLLLGGSLTVALAQKKGGPKPSGPNPTNNPRPFPSVPPKPTR